MEFLKEFLGDVLYAQVAEKLGGNEKIKLVNAADGAYISKEAHDAAVAKAKNDGIEEGKQSIDTTELDELKSSKERLEKEFNSYRFNSALELKLATSGARNAKALKGLIDESKLTYDEEGLHGFDEQLEAIKADNDYLFEAPAAGGMRHGASAQNADGVERSFLEKNPGLKVD